MDIQSEVQFLKIKEQIWGQGLILKSNWGILSSSSVRYCLLMVDPSISQAKLISGNRKSIVSHTSSGNVHTYSWQDIMFYPSNKECFRNILYTFNFYCSWSAAIYIIKKKNKQQNNINLMFLLGNSLMSNQWQGEAVEKFTFFPVVWICEPLRRGLQCYMQSQK